MKELALIGILLAASTGVNAGTISTFTDRATFDSNVGTTTLENFTASPNFPIPGGSLSSTSSFGTLLAGDIQAGATYTSPVGSGNYFNIDAGGGFVGGFLDGFNPSDRDLTITYSPLISAFGFETNSLMPNFDITINFLTGTSYTSNFSLVGSGLQFFGFQSSATDIQSVVISGNNSFFGFAIDNHVFGGTRAQSVPEPATLALLGLGLLGMGLSRKKKAA